MRLELAADPRLLVATNIGEAGDEPEGRRQDGIDPAKDFGDEPVDIHEGYRSLVQFGDASDDGLMVHEQ